MHIKSALGLLCSIDAGGYDFGQTECLAHKQQNRLRQQGVLPHTACMLGDTFESATDSWPVQMCYESGFRMPVWQYSYLWVVG